MVKEELVATLQPNLGYLRHVEPNPTNTACVLLTEDKDCISRYIFQGKVYERDFYCPAFSLSFDGKKLAILSPEIDRVGKVAILINGEVTYKTGLDVLYRLQWLSNDELAWNGWNESENKTERLKDYGYYINGQNMTDRFEFECFYGSSVLVKMDSLVYQIDPSGNRSESRIVKGERYHNWGFFDKTESREQPKTVQVGNEVAVNFGGKTGPLFHAIGLAKGFHAISVDQQTQQPYYIGMRYSKAATLISRVAEYLLEKAEKIEDRRKGRPPIWGWPLVFLFGPYSPLPLGAVFIEKSKRYYPVYGDCSWRSGYKEILDHLLTPSGKMAVVVHEDEKEFVVVDEEKVSLDYDSIHHCVFLANEGICFIGQRDNDFFRVVIN